MRYFKYREEGKELKVGFNFYRLSDKTSFGFIFYCAKFKFRVGFSKIARRLHINFMLKPDTEFKGV